MAGSRMRRWVPLLIAALLLSACARTPAPPTPTPPTSGVATGEPGGPPAAPRLTLPPAPAAVPNGNNEPPAPAVELPTVQRQPGHIMIRAAGGLVQAALSPGAQQVAILYGTGTPQHSTVALGALPLRADGPVRELARFPSAATAPANPILAGWLDDQRVVVLTAAKPADDPTAPDGGALRAEVWDIQSGLRTSATAWVPLAGQGLMGWPQAWLAGSGDTARVLLKTGALWRLDPVGGQLQRLVEDLPAIKNLGTFVSASPDRWHALYGGGLNQARHGVVDLHTGKDLPLPEAWRRMVWGGMGHLLALSNTEQHPGQVLGGWEAVWDFYGTVVVAGVDGKPLRQLPLPTGLLAAEAHETAAGWLVVETVRLTKDATNQEFGYQVANGPLLTAGPTDDVLRPRWDWSGPYGPGAPKPWLLAGNWLLADHQQIPLAGGKSLPWPTGIQAVLPEPEAPTQPPHPPLVVGSNGSELSFFTAGQTEAHPLAQASEQSLLQWEATEGWTALRFYGEGSRSELHVVQIAK